MDRLIQNFISEKLFCAVDDVNGEKNQFQINIFRLMITKNPFFKMIFHISRLQNFETNSNFRSFFLSLPIPSFFRPTFFNMQFLSAHGNFNNYLHRMNIISSPFCECNRFIQDPQHILFNCDYYNFSNRHQFISPDQFLLNQHNFNLFNQICCCYFSKKITVN